jgi:hypothetical protein
MPHAFSSRRVCLSSMNDCACGPSNNSFSLHMKLVEKNLFNFKILMNILTLYV